MSSNVDQTPGPPGGHWQAITNERFPRDARTIPDQRHPIPVIVRVLWERDGEEWIDGEATRWTDHVVFVTFGDRRLSTTGVWWYRATFGGALPRSRRDRTSRLAIPCVRSTDR
jgi:hypothetical protein